MPRAPGCGRVAFGSLVAALAVVEKIAPRVPRHGTKHHIPEHPLALFFGNFRISLLIKSRPTSKIAPVAPFLARP